MSASRCDTYGKRQRTMHGIAMVLLGLLVSIPAQAQDSGISREDYCQLVDCSNRPREAVSEVPVPIGVVTVDEIVVTGAPLRPLGNETRAIDVIDGDRIRSTASGRIEDALRDAAGLIQFRRTDARSANATSQGATLRGLGGNASSRALLVLDGVPQTDPFGGWVTWPAFAAERVGAIRLARGGGHVGYGAGALAGLIEIDSVSPPRETSLRGSALYGSRNAVDTSAFLGGALGAGSGFVTASFARGDGFIPIVQRQRGPADRASPYQQANFAARGVAPLDAQTELQANLLGFSDRRQRGTILSENGGEGGDASLRLVHRARWQIEALAYVQLRSFRSRFVAIDAARAAVTQTVDQYNVPSTGIGAKFEVRPPLGDAIKLRIGADWRRTTGVSKELFTYVAGRPTRGREAGGSADVIGLFTEAEATLGDLTLSAGARLDRWRLGAGRLIERPLAGGALLRNDRSQVRDGAEPTARIGLAWQPGDWTLRTALSQSWRLPTLNELYRPFRVGADATAANAALRPETAQGVEAGLGWARDDVALSVTGYANRLNDAVANATLARGPGVFPGVGFVAAGGAYRQRLNVDAIKAHGIEAKAQMRLGDWRLETAYAWTRARVDASGVGAALDGLVPAQTPSHLLSATLGWKWLSTTLRWTSGQFEDDLNQRRLAAAVTFDASARVPVTKRLGLLLRSENATGARVDAAISALGVIERAAPRSFWIGLDWR